MELIRNKDSMYITNEEDKKILEMGYIVDEFAIIFYRSEPVVVSKELDEKFYEEFSKFLDNQYDFSDKVSMQDKDTMLILSDLYGHLNTEIDIKDINRLVITKNEEAIALEVYNPYFKERKINKEYNIVLFSDTGASKHSKNKETGASLQDDIITTFSNILEKDKIKTRKK